MDLSEGNEEHSSYRSSTLTSDWQFSSQIENQMNSIPMVWNQGGISNFPSDSRFVQRFSCFDAGSFGQTPMNNDQTQRDSGEAEVSGDGEENSCSRGNGVKKRKRSNQEMELDQVQDASPLSIETAKDKKGDQKSASSKNSGKSNAKDGADGGAKEDYIHVRARRGQATNSHSLAERVRREKISERMKFLQDLVPGCSKVTGKAVMLDEIINYVQSLQRQVEFLSMKLATVNPRLDFNIEGLISKDLLHLRGSSSVVGGFLPEMIRPQFQQGLVQGGVPGMGNMSDALRRAIDSQLTPMNGFKEHLPQMPNAWEEELHNVVQMNFAANPPFNNQELSTKPGDGLPL